MASDAGKLRDRHQRRVPYWRQGRRAKTPKPDIASATTDKAYQNSFRKLRFFIGGWRKKELEEASGRYTFEISLEISVADLTADSSSGMPGIA